MENTKICENTIENMKFELFTNNNEKCYQALKISTVGASSSTNRIAPVDFYTISTAIMCSKTLDEFIAAVSGTWSDELLESMINDVFDEANGLI